MLLQGVMKHLPQQQQQDMLRQWTALFQKSGTNFLQYLSLLQHGKVWLSPTAPLLLCYSQRRTNLRAVCAVLAARDAAAARPGPGAAAEAACSPGWLSFGKAAACTAAGAAVCPARSAAAAAPPCAGDTAHLMICSSAKSQVFSDNCCICIYL